MMVKRMSAISVRPFREFWREVIEMWVIAQHVHWSAVRGTDGKKCLRLALEGSGWIRVRKKASRQFDPTQDRLLSMLSLGVECDLFERVDSVEGQQYGVIG